MTSLVVVDDHPVVAAGLAVWCAAARPPLRIVAAGADSSVAWLPPGDQADVVVLDLERSGSAAPAWGELRRLTDAGRQVVVHARRADGDAMARCLDLGALAHLTKAEGEQHLVAAVRAAAAGRPYTAPESAPLVARIPAPRLAPRETEVLLEWFRCESKELVARRLHLSPRTVAGYLDRVRVKYADAGRPAATKAALVARALQDGLVEVHDL